MVFSQALTSYFQRKRSSTTKMRRGRRKRRRRGDNLVAPDIPLDVLIEILTRLPAKSLMRFKCVSNLWSSLIRSRYFSNRCLNRCLTVASPPRPPHLYMSLEYCLKPYESILLSLSSSSSSSSSYDQYLSMPWIRGSNMVVVLRSLILYTVCGPACIYNPTTRQSVTLPAIKPFNIFPQERIRFRRHYVFGHDPVLDQYKVVCNVCIHSKTTYKLIASENWVFVVEAGGSWKRIEFDQHHRRTNPGVCINGVIYYLAFTLMSSDIVVSFDVRSEEFNMIQIPLVETAYFESMGLIEYGGKPAIIKHTIQKGLVDLWVLDNAGNWSRKSLVVKPCQMQLLDRNLSFHLKGTTQNGEIILAPYSLLIPRCPSILFYDLQKNDLRKVMIRLPNHGLLKSYRNVLANIKPADMSESIIHLET